MATDLVEINVEEPQREVLERAAAAEESPETTPGPAIAIINDSRPAGRTEAADRVAGSDSAETESERRDGDGRAEIIEAWFEDEQGVRAEALATINPGDGVLPAGGDCDSAIPLRRAGERLSHTDLAAFAAAGVARITVREPRIRVLPLRGSGIIHAAA